MTLVLFLKVDQQLSQNFPWIS